MTNKLYLITLFLYIAGANCMQIPSELMDYTITQSDELIYSMDENDRIVMVSANYMLEKVDNGQEDTSV
jgi:hypothetical protein